MENSPLQGETLGVCWFMVEKVNWGILGATNIARRIISAIRETPSEYVT